jgi:hypothetical protein
VKVTKEKCGTILKRAKRVTRWLETEVNSESSQFLNSLEVRNECNSPKKFSSPIENEILMESKML